MGKIKMFHYVYRITCIHPDSKEKYYYGVRSSKIAPENDVYYWSSSVLVKFARNQLRKRVLQEENSKIVPIS